MSTRLIPLRNTISKVVTEYPEAKAQKLLSHPVFGKVLEVARTAKPEVLASKPEDYEGDQWSKDALISEINLRNENRDEADHIPSTGNKPDLIGFLIADDKKADD